MLRCVERDERKSPRLCVQAIMELEGVVCPLLVVSVDVLRPAECQ
jgi:hypothetical protein